MVTEWAAGSEPSASRTGPAVGNIWTWENPPNGAIVHYWLDEGISGPVSLAFYDEGSAAIASFRSDDSSSPAAKRPSVRPGSTASCGI